MLWGRLRCWSCIHGVRGARRCLTRLALDQKSDLGWTGMDLEIAPGTPGGSDLDRVCQIGGTNHL